MLCVCKKLKPKRINWMSAFIQLICIPTTIVLRERATVEQASTAKRSLIEITYSPWEDINSEGRIIQADFGELSVISIYLPSGSSKEERQAFKMEFISDRFLPHLRKLQKDGRKYIICGDWNIAHKKIDLKNWRSNQKNSGFLPEERAWLDTLYDEVGYVDSFREINHEEFQYTWWSNRGQAWLNNTGWRLDYHVVSSNLAGLATSCEIYKEERFSDHSPLIIDYNL